MALICALPVGAAGMVALSDPKPETETFDLAPRSTLILTKYNPLELREVRPVAAPKISPPGKRPATVRQSFKRSQERVEQLQGGAGGKLASIRQCESRGDYGAVSASGKYKGAYQFDAPTHRSVGGDGDASDDSPAEQDAAAARLLARDGPGKWPSCGRR